MLFLSVVPRYLAVLISVFFLLPFSPATAADSESLISAILAAARSGDDASLMKARTELENIAKPEKGDLANAKKWNDEGLTALKQGQSSSAVRLLKQASGADPANVEAANNLGFALLKAGDYTEAEAVLRKAITLSPGRSSAWLNLGEAMGAAGKTESAGASFYTAWVFSQNRDRTLTYVSKLASGENAPLASAAKQAVDTISKTSRPGSTSAADKPSVPGESVAPPAASSVAGNDTNVDVPAGNLASTPAAQGGKGAEPAPTAPREAEKEGAPGNAAVAIAAPGFGISDGFEKLFGLGMVVLVIGLAKPAWVMRWSSNPTRLKLFAIMLVVLVPTAMLARSTKSPERLAYEKALLKQSEEAHRQKAEQDARLAAEARVPLIYGSWTCVGSGEKIKSSSGATHKFGPDGFRASSNNNLSDVWGSFEQDGLALTLDLKMTAPDGQKLDKRYAAQISKLDKHNLVYVMPFKYPVTYTCTR